LHAFNELGCGKQGVTALRHGCGAGMIGKPANLDIVVIEQSARKPSLNHSSRQLPLLW